MKCTAEDFETMESEWRKYGNKEEKYKNEVTKYREDLRTIDKDEERTTGKANVQNDDDSNDFGTMDGYTEGHVTIQPIEEQLGITSC